MYKKNYDWGKGNNGTWSYISRCTFIIGLEEVSLTTLLELAELKPNADNLVNLQVRL
jgi:hypothetical protein